jgi:hypothetical protein
MKRKFQDSLEAIQDAASPFVIVLATIFLLLAAKLMEICNVFEWFMGLNEFWKAILILAMLPFTYVAPVVLCFVPATFIVPYVLASIHFLFTRNEKEIITESQRS